MAQQKSLPTYCYNCVSGPDLLRVTVEGGVAKSIEPDHRAQGVHPADGRPCVKAYGLVQKTYNPHRIKTPMKRTNPKKGKDQDPGFVPISWDEALDLIAEKLCSIRSRGLLDDQGLPRLAATFGHGGTPAHYMGTLPAFLSAWGPIDYSFGSGQGVKCVHSEHLYGEFWHRAFTVCADTVSTKYIVSFGTNVEVTGGVCAVRRHADARIRGVKRVQVEPHISPTAACSAEWVPIKPKTDAAFMLAMVHTLLFEAELSQLDVPFLRDRTASPYLVGPEGWYLRDPETAKPLIWDINTSSPVPFDTEGANPAIEGTYRVSEAITREPDEEIRAHKEIEGRTSFDEMVEAMRTYTPEWAEDVCDVPSATIRRVALEYLENASIGETTEINGKTLPLRPVAITLGKTVNNGWGAFECCWSRTVLAMLVGALEVPGGTIGTTIRINKPHENRLLSVKVGEDGFMASKFNPTGKDTWISEPTGRNAHRTLIPIVGNSPWSQALGPTHLAWLFLRETPKDWPKPTHPEVWFAYRTNPAISFWETDSLSATMATMPFIVGFAYTHDETNHMADILLPDATDLESTQLTRIGGTKFTEQHWHHQGVALRQPIVAPQGEAKDFSWIAAELAKRTGIVDKFTAALNRGTICAPLKGESYDYSLVPEEVDNVETVWDSICKATTAELTDGKDVKDLNWFKENGWFVTPFDRADWYLTPTMEEKGLRYELPYQERLLRTGKELERRLHEKGIRWWDKQLTEYQAIPRWHDVPSHWAEATRALGKEPKDYPFWAITTKSMPYTTGNNVGIPLMNEAAENLRGHGSVTINADSAQKLGIADGDWVEVSSPVTSTIGKAKLIQGCRPDTVVIPGQFAHWKTPIAKNFNFPSLNKIAPLSSVSLALTDATGSGADIVQVQLRKVKGPIEAGESK